MKRILEASDTDRRLAQEINTAARSDAQSPYLGKFVAISAGQVVATGNSLEEAITAWEACEAATQGGLVFEAGADYQTEHEIWNT